MRQIKIPQVIEKQTGNYQLPNSYDRKELKRGSIEFAIDTLSRLYKVQPKEALPFLKVYDYTNVSDFITYDIISLGGGILQAEPLKYLFYGDVIITTLDDPSGTEDFTANVLCHKSLLDKSQGISSVGLGYSASGGAGKANNVTLNNAFVSWLTITNVSGGVSTNAYNTIKLEGFLIRIS